MAFFCDSPRIGATDIDELYGASGSPNGSVHDIALLEDQKAIIVGNFSEVAGTPRAAIARLNVDGTVDPSFNPGAGANGLIRTAAIQTDGKIVIGGDFSQVGGEARARLARLNPDGSLDTEFLPTTGINSSIYDLAIATDGSILVGGAFTQIAGASQPYLARLSESGSLSSGYQPTLNNQVQAMELRPDGTLTIGGVFTSVNGQTRHRIARLNPDGSIDPTFDPGFGPNSSVRTIKLQSDQRILIGGDFTSVGGQTWRYLARLNPDGLLDRTFAWDADRTVNAIALQPDGKILVGGNFANIAGQPRNRLARLQTDGSMDPTFDVGDGANAQVHAIVTQLDGNILAGGDFSQIGGLGRNGLVRFNGLSAAPGGQIEFGANEFFVNESQPSATITVRRSGASSAAVSVEYQTSNGSANAGDYTPQIGALSFAIGETEKTFSIPLRSDNSLEENETVNLELLNPTGGAELGSVPTATLVILDDDFTDQVGGLDLSFPANAFGKVSAMAIQPDGKLIAIGNFKAVGGLNPEDQRSRVNIARFNLDGSVDPSFHPAAWLDNEARAIVVQPDGRILVGGDFTQVNGATRNRIVRLRPDGRLDPTFDPATGPNSSVYAIALEPDGDILIGGAFSQFNGQPHAYLARLFPDGSLDTEFNASANQTIHTLKTLPDNRVLLGGVFTSVNGESRNRIARLNPDGSLDPSFDPGLGPNSAVRTLVPQPDQKILIGGDFTSVGGQPWTYLARLGPDGLLDRTFAWDADRAVNAIALQTDGKVVVGGNFNNIAGQPRNRVTRLLNDGSIDPTFGAGDGANAQVHALAIQPDGAIFVGGEFTQLMGLSRSGLARLNGLSSAPGGEVEFTAGEFFVGESQSSATITVRRAGNANASVSVDYQTSNGTANAGDYTPQLGSLTFSIGETEKAFSIPLRSDNSLEENETVNLELLNPTGGAELGSVPTATLKILDDDFTDQVGGLDLSFAANAFGKVSAVATQPDGKLIVIGNFKAVGGANPEDQYSRVNIARFNFDGSIDPTFHPAAWLDNEARAIVVYPDGRILIGGDFTTVNGVTRNRIARLRPDGRIDPTFNPPGGANTSVHAIALQPNQDILVGGAFTQFNGQTQNYLARLFTDGTLDTEFDASTNNQVFEIKLLPDHRVLVGGSFTAINGATRNRIASLNPDGSLDPSFDPGFGPNSNVRSIAIQPNGRLLIGGDFTSVGGQTWTYLARLHADGLLDPSFAWSADRTVNAIALQPDGKVLVGGNFTNIAGQPRNRIARLLSDGSIDPTFDVSEGANAQVHAVAVQLDGNIIVGGEFTRLTGLPRNGLARLNGLSAAPGGQLEFSASEFFVNESQSNATITVRRSGNTSAPVAVDYQTANGSANAGDYLPQSGTLVFATGEIEKTFSVPLRPDDFSENSESVILTLFNPTNGAILGSLPMATLWIEDDDILGNTGSVDASFHSSVFGAVSAIAVQTDEKLIVAGNFKSVGGASSEDQLSRVNIARFNPDGSIDPTFHPAAWLDNEARTVLIQPDGRVLVGGDFTLVNGATRNRIVRLRTDGQLDPTFNPPGGANSSIYALDLEPDGDVLIAGAFTQFNGQNQGYIARLFSDGSLDPGFNASVNNQVYAMKLLPNNRLLIGGVFTSVNGETRNRVAILNSDGSLDPSFDPGAGPNSSVRSLEALPDSKILIAGDFSSIGGQSYPYLARLLETGALDTTFNPSPNSPVYALALLPEQKILAGGNFTSIDGQSQNRLARLSANGSLDPTLEIGTGPNATVRAILATENAYVVGGEFTQFNDLERHRLVRLHATDTPIEIQPLIFTSIDVIGDALRVSASGQPGATYSIDISTNLNTWDFNQTITSQTGLFEFTLQIPNGTNSVYIRESNP